MDKFETKNTSGQGFAIASLVIGIVSILIAIIPCIGVLAILLGIVSVVFGSISLHQSNKNNSPRGIGITGLTLGVLSVLLAFFWLTFVIGSTNQIKNGVSNFFGIAEEFNNSEMEFENMESLDDLEKTLDELEIETYEVDSSVPVDDSTHNSN